MAKEPPKSRLSEQIDENLKRVYENTLSEPVPDRFRLLLEQLKARDAEK
jgi:hypothetical protein